MPSSSFIATSANLRRGLLPVFTLLAAACAQVAHADAPSSSTSLPLNPFALQVPKIPQAFAAGDGRTHLTWEVQATSLAAVPATVRSIAVWADGGAQPLLEYASPDAIGAHVSPLAKPLCTPGKDDCRIDRVDPSGAATIWIDLALAAGTPVPDALETRITVVGEGISASDATTRVRFAVDKTPVRVIHPPLAGTSGGVFEACCDAANHHRRGQRSVDGHFVLPERYAIDFVKVDKNGNTFAGDGKRNEDYFSFGAPVLAVADATVVDVYDELVDAPPQQPLPPATLPKAGGNHVILDLGGGVWAMYGHLKAHSIRVKAGDHVAPGEVIAQLGNNGNSDMAHLHFQLMDSRNFAQSQGVPFLFDRYRQVGRADAETDRVIVDGRPAPRENALPLSLSIVDFEESPGRR
jgi:hypothetical protein